ncbi:hypothetical protein [Asticcacaulis solisilvae]|uniref:hypothetical protein n=1 Tax=Asticcacaulis solisilvae TaxID=1217274 RepID=UPI003FD89A40
MKPACLAIVTAAIVGLSAASAHAKQAECAAWTTTPAYQMHYHAIFDIVGDRLVATPGSATVTLVAAAISGPAKDARLVLTPGSTSEHIVFSTSQLPDRSAQTLFLKVRTPDGADLGRFRIIPPTATDSVMVADLATELADRLTAVPVDLIVEADGKDVQTYRFDLSGIPWQRWKIERDTFYANAPDMKTASDADPKSSHCAPVLF